MKLLKKKEKLDDWVDAADKWMDTIIESKITIVVGWICVILVILYFISGVW